MKYEVHSNHGTVHRVVFPGFHIETVHKFGADKLAEELNRLDQEVNKANESLAVQIEAKCKALKRVEELDKQVFDGECENKALEQRLGVRTSQISKLLDVLERAQMALALYIEPGASLKPKAVLTDLMGILDDGALVSTMRNLRELILVKDNGSVELTCGQKKQVLSALDNIVMAYPDIWPDSVSDNYHNACRILGADEVVRNDTEYLNKGANGERLRESIRQHREGKFPQVGDEATVVLKRGENGEQYIAGIRFGIEQPFIVKADQVYVNGACIEKSAVSAMELGTAIHEGFERVVNNTVNQFGPDEKLKRKIRKLKHRIEGLVIERDELLMEVKQNSERD